MPKNIVVPAEVFSRVSGYFRPVNQWNNGKREEFTERLYADLDKSMSRFTTVCTEKSGIITS